jgi:iron complex outermembrane receptor protein
MKTLLSAVVGAVLVLGAIQVHADRTPGKRQVSLEIEAKTLAEALDQWAQKTGFQIIVKDWPLTKRLPAPNLKGTFDARDALEQLLNGSPLTCDWVSDNLVSIREKQNLTPPAPWRTIDGSPSPRSVQKFIGDGLNSPKLAATGEPTRVSGAEGTRGAVDKRQITAVEEVVVTGTHLRNAYPAGSPVRKYGRREIEGSGALTTEQFTDLIPQNFGGGVSQDTGATFVPPDGKTNANEGFGSGINLRGLGAEATLVLLNGHRLTQTGAGTFVDVSQIPLSAVERIDVLTDGASAIYGSDAVAGVVNIVLRRDFQGAETRLRYGSVTDGDFARYGFGQTLGTVWRSGGAFLSYDFVGQDNLSRTDRPFASAPVGDLLPETSAHSALLNGHQDVGTGVLRYDLLYSQRYAHFVVPESAASIAADRRLYAPSESYRGALSFDAPLNSRWTARVAIVGSSSDIRSTFSSLDGTPVIQVDSIHKNTLTSAGANVAGVVGQAAGGPIMATVGLDYRRERFDADLLVENVSFQPLDASRTIRSAFAEAFIPLVGSAGDGSGQSLDLSLAVRHERYSDFGETTNPKLGVVWAPLELLRLRGTFGTSFRAPAFDQNTDSTGSTLLVYLPDPDDAHQSLGLVRAGTKSGVGRERARTWTAGIEWSSSSATRNAFTANIDYFNTRYDDRIQLPSSAPFSVLAEPSVYAPIITRNLSPEQINDAILNPGGFGFADLTDGQDPNAAVVIVDGRVQNIAATQISGVDIALASAMQSRSIDWNFTFDATYFINYENQISPVASDVSIEGTVFNPPKWRARGGVSARFGKLAANLYANHIPGYDNNLTLPVGSIDSWTTLDASVAYEFSGDEVALLRKAVISIGAQNLLDEAPPRVSGSGAITLLPVGYDAANANALQRFLSVELKKTF